MGTVDIASISPAAMEAKRLRQEEYLETLKSNAASSIVRRVLLLVEGVESMALLKAALLDHPRYATTHAAVTKKIFPILVRRQPTYADLFRVPTRLLAADRSAQHRELFMVCNSDIHMPTDTCRWFPVDKLQSLFHTFHSKRRPAVSYGHGTGAVDHVNSRLVLALTRYEGEQGLPLTPCEAPLVHDYRGSHDAFLFDGPLPPRFLDAVGHPQNCYKAENIVIHELQRKANAVVVNPCLEFRVVHRHAADVRQWLPPVDEDRYGRAYPDTLENIVASW